MHVRDEKAAVRKTINERLAHMSDSAYNSESRSLCKRILGSLPGPPLSIAAFFPLKTEVDIRPLLLTLLQRQDSLYLPCFENGTLTFRKAMNLTDLPKGALEIPEPPESSPHLVEKDLDIALVPGRAFDDKGYRLGRGNGGYDIWIEKLRQINTLVQVWGVALECQLVRQVPREDHDQKMDAVITARGKKV